MDELVVKVIGVPSQTVTLLELIVGVATVGFKTAVVLVTVPQLFVNDTWYSLLFSAAGAALKFKVAVEKFEYTTPLSIELAFDPVIVVQVPDGALVCHLYVKLAPVAAAVKLVPKTLHKTLLLGCAVIVGALLIVSVSTFE